MNRLINFFECLVLFASLSFVACSEDSSSSADFDAFLSEINYVEGTVVDSRDGQTYKTVTIGSQTWMAQNLNYQTAYSYCYGDDTSNCAKYGRFYKWVAAIGKSESECGFGHICSLPSGNIQGVCFSGWHLPSLTEWETLFSVIGGYSKAGKVLKSTSGWAVGKDCMDAIGFSAFATGFRNGYGVYDFEGYDANFWCSTEYDKSGAYNMYLHVDYDGASLGSTGKEDGLSVRCLKD